MQASFLGSDGANDAGFNPLYQMAYPIKIATSRWLGSRTVERPTQSEVVRSDVQNWSLTASWMERGPPDGNFVWPNESTQRDSLWPDRKS